MIRYFFNIRKYWKVIAYFDIDYDFFDYVAHDLKGIGVTKEEVDSIYSNMTAGNGMAFTCSNNYTSIVGFNRHDDEYDLINSIVHEAEHVKQAILDTYHIEDHEEPPAYIMGYLIERMYKIIQL